jgi:hypothetical protein
VTESPKPKQESIRSKEITSEQRHIMLDTVAKKKRLENRDPVCVVLYGFSFLIYHAQVCEI